MSSTNAPYFPPLYGDVECHNCEKENCPCRGKYQRNIREMEVTSGRCPRLPDMSGFVDKSERELFANTFALVHAELGCEAALNLMLSIPCEKRNRKIYQTKSGYWYYKWKDTEGSSIKQMLRISGYHSKEEIVRYMEGIHADYCLIPCQITEYIV